MFVLDALRIEKEYIDEKGFTKIQVIIFVALAIILILGFLLSLSLFGYQKRDESRVSDLKLVREALFSYYNENGYYPSSVSNWDADRADYGADIDMATNDYDNLASLISHIVPKLPKDPLNSANSPAFNQVYIYRYVSSSDGKNFALVFETERKGDDSPVAIKGW